MGLFCHDENSQRYPRCIFLIIAAEFCERFSFTGLRTILSLYLRNVLLFHEDTSTIIYHVFMMVCYLVPLVGAMLSDSLVGGYRTILYFSWIYTAGNMILCLAASPPVGLPAISMTMIALTTIAIGVGGLKPCLAAFGGDQYSLPQQNDWLQEFFSMFYLVLNIGVLLGTIIAPMFRKLFSCFGSDSCYLLGFGFPAAFMVLAIFLFMIGKPCYKMRSPKQNIILNCILCSSHAVQEILTSKNRNVKHAHWLDYSIEKFGPKLVQDMKIVLGIFFMFIPLPIFWSLFDQQFCSKGSRWTFQASRMDGKVAGVHIFPDQMQVLNPAFVVMLIPLFDWVVYPWMDRRCHTNALHKMAIGGIFAGLSFIASGILELAIEQTYPVLPLPGFAHLNVINTLPCDIQLVNPFNKMQIITATDLHVFRNVTADNVTSYRMLGLAPYDCNGTQFEWPSLELTYVPFEAQVDTLIIAKFGHEIKYFNAESDNLVKSLSGKPKIRVIFLQDGMSSEAVTITLSNVQGLTDSYFAPPRNVAVSAYMELDPGRYNFSISNTTLAFYQEEILLKLGAVYSLVVIDVGGKITYSKMYVLTPPNTVHMMWLLPQYLLLSIAEVMLGIAGLHFSFTQAPKSMKTVALAGWYVTVAVGNLFVIIIMRAKIVKSQANEFFLFAGLLSVSMVFFMVISTRYTFTPSDYDASDTLLARKGEEIPLLDTNEPSDQVTHK